MTDKTPTDLQLLADTIAVEHASFEYQLKELKARQTAIDTSWKELEKAMIDHDIKSIKGDWGSVTIAERDVFSGSVDDVPRKFIKKALDTKKIKTFFTLEGKLPKGVEHRVTKYLTKRIK